MIDWMSFFVDSIETVHEEFKVVLDAVGCREGWLQAELYLAARRLEYPLATNSYPLGDRKRADLSSGDPPAMIAEVKVTGGWDAPKMQGRVEEDVRRMQQADVGDAERYMILLIRESDPTRPLAVYLDTCDFQGKCERRDWDGFSLKAWRLDATRPKRALGARVAIEPERRQVKRRNPSFPHLSAPRTPERVEAVRLKPWKAAENILTLARRNPAGLLLRYAFPNKRLLLRGW